MGTDIGTSSGEVFLKQDSLLRVYLIGYEENTYIADTLLSKNPITFLNQQWRKCKSTAAYISLNRDSNNKLIRVGILNPKGMTTWWIEN